MNIKDNIMHTHKLEHPIPGAQPAYLANGLIGLRVGSNPLLGGTALVNGYVGINEHLVSEAYAPAPYPLQGDLQVGPIWMSERSDLVVFQSQDYDFSCGELTTRFAFRADDAAADVKVLTFCSRTHPMVVVQEVEVAVDRPCRLTVRALMNPLGLPGRMLSRNMPKENADGVLLWEAPGGLARCGAAFRTEFSGYEAPVVRSNNWGYEGDQVLRDYVVEAHPGRTCVLRQYGCLVPSVMHSEPHWQAMRILGLIPWHGFEKIRQDNRAAWCELWKGRVVAIGADDKWQQVLDAAFFYLHSSAHASMPCSVAPCGLGSRDHYLGHIFWDTETFMFPPLLLTNPSAARAMLDYRSRALQAAKFNAQMHGYQGVQFPWESCYEGVEVAPVWAPGAAAEHHINMDVAFAFAQHVHATGDDAFARRHAWPVLEGVAEWITSRVKLTERGYEIRNVLGPDEELANVNNNAFTNIASVVVLREAAALARRLGYDPPAAWEDVAAGMFIPIDPRTGVILKHDRYEYKGGMLNPETLAVFFPFPYSHSKAVDDATVKYHMEHARTYLGMPLLSALLGVFAARRGERELAAELFAEGIFPFVIDPFMMFTEVSGRIARGRRTAPFLTNAASFLMACLYGLTGLQLDSGDPQDWARHPITLPEGWDAIEVERIWVRGKPMRLTARHGDKKAKLEKHT